METDNRDILIDGKTKEMFSVNGHSVRHRFDTDRLPLDHPARIALEVGMEVLKRMNECDKSDRKITDVAWTGQRHIGIYLSKAKPAPIVGLEWLQSLKMGTRIEEKLGIGKCVIVDCGIFLVHCCDYYPWKKVLSSLASLSQTASPETCPEW